MACNQWGNKYVITRKASKEKNTEISDNKNLRAKKIQQIQEDPYASIKSKIHSRIIDEIKSDALKDLDDDGSEALEHEITSIVENILNEENSYITKNERQKIISEIIDETIGLGPINPLIHDPTISEIMVNGPNKVYVEKGRLVLSDVRFKDDQHVIHVIEKIVAPIGRRVDESSPMVDARLPNGSRVNVIIPP